MKLTLCGIDYKYQAVAKIINIWKDYNDRAKGIVKRLKHGRTVTLIDEYKEYVYVRCGLFKKGYVSKLLIKEMKYGEAYFREIGKRGVNNRRVKRQNNN